MSIDGRIGTAGTLDPLYLKELQLDDYLVADFRSSTSGSINLYVAYYDVQAEGAGTIHSPRSCLPGSGWRINEILQKDIPDIEITGVPLTVNRAVISRDNHQVIVYYWMQQRGRIITNEFMAKWWIFRDRLLMGRSDGALIRVMAEVDQFGSVEKAEREMQLFIAGFTSELPHFVPN